jgi:uncharacterized protein (TIGR03067 family)
MNVAAQRCMSLFTLLVAVGMVACKKNPPAATPDPSAEAIKNPSEELIKKEIQAAAEERSKLQGKWKHLSIVDSGLKMPPDVVSETFYYFDGASFRNEVKGQVKSKGSFTLDTKASPARIDFDVGGRKTLVGIFRLNGNKMTLCLSDKRRPATFESNAVSGTLLLNLEREN